MPDAVTRAQWQLLLSPKNYYYSLGYIAEHWDPYRDLALDDVIALLRDELKHVLDVIDEKRTNPLAALVAATILVRGRRLLAHHDRELVDSAGQWLRNLAAWFPELPDALVLYHQYRRDIDDPDPDPELDLCKLVNRPLPYLAEPLAVLATLVADTPDDPDPTRPNVSHDPGCSHARSA